MGLNLEPLKEPRGFIRIIQIFMAILAFSTTSSFDADALVKGICRSQAVGEAIDACNDTYEIAYPFNTHAEIHCKMSVCKIPPEKEQTLVAVNINIDHESAAEFYVTTGVLSFLYGLATIVVYTMLMEAYENSPLFPFVDLVATGVLAFFWFISWCVWVAQSGSVKSTFLDVPVKMCDSLTHSMSVPAPYTFECVNQKSINFTKLTVSLVFGFGNIILWAGSTWFVYKETSFHRAREMRAQYNSDMTNSAAGIGGTGPQATYQQPSVANH